MRFFNFDIEKSLWRRMEIRASVLGLSIREFTTKSLEDAIADPSFNPKRYATEKKNFVRKNIPKKPSLWPKVSEAAAKNNVTKREYVCAAIAASVNTTVLYPTAPEGIVLDYLRLPLDILEYLRFVTGHKMSAEELISRLAEDLKQGDPRLTNWLDEQKV